MGGMADSSIKALEESVVLHKLVIDELIKENETLKIDLEHADKKIGELTVQLIRLENGQLELVAKLEHANSEISRLEMILPHQE